MVLQVDKRGILANSTIDMLQGFYVSARIGDALYTIARARSIWAAQTAQAMQDIGSNATLVGSKANYPFEIKGPSGVKAMQRTISALYNIDADFRIMLLYGSNTEENRNGTHEVEFDLPRYVLPYCNLMQTRDPRVAALCFQQKIPFIYEDHNEDYNIAASSIAPSLNSSSCKAVVAITEIVAERLEFTGVLAKKITVQDSGVNSRAFRSNTEKKTRWRRFFMGQQYERLVVYTGGIQAERGISQVLDAARELKDTIFVFAGGNRSQVKDWLTICEDGDLENVRFLGYLPQSEVCDLQQSADIVLMSRQAGPQAGITSPLKFFEYLASGTPVVAAAIPAVSRFQSKDIAVQWFDPAASEPLKDAILACAERFPFRRDGYAVNVDLARDFTWKERQLKILKFAGILDGELI